MERANTAKVRLYIVMWPVLRVAFSLRCIIGLKYFLLGIMPKKRKHPVSLQLF